MLPPPPDVVAGGRRPVAVARCFKKQRSYFTGSTLLACFLYSNSNSNSSTSSFYTSKVLEVVVVAQQCVCVYATMRVAM